MLKTNKDSNFSRDAFICASENTNCCLKELLFFLWGRAGDFAEAKASLHHTHTLSLMLEIPRDGFKEK